MAQSSTATIHDIDRLILPECREAIRREIESLHGAEVFFVGRLDGNLAIEDVEAYGFGNRNAVPALLQHARPGDVILHNHPSDNLEPSAADIDISSTVGERGIGSYIINNDCTEVRLVVKPTRPEQVQPIDLEALTGMLSPGGSLADSLEGYEFRPSQIEMLKAVGEAFNEDGIAVIEAATGTGKSLAYLLPALAWSLKNQEKVVVSTHTINLQEQLVEKDLPLLKQNLGLEFDAVLLKGRNNYLCRRKAHYLRRHPDFLEDSEKQEQLDSIQAWIKTTRDGSRSDLEFAPDRDVWERVMSESDNCLRTKCPFYQVCFFYTARRRAARANVLVVNHHLLMADLAVRDETDNYTQAAVLPPFHRIVLDEAHHLEDVATHYFGSRFSRLGFLMLLRRFAMPRTGEGLFRYLSTLIHDGTYRFEAEEAKHWMLELSRDLMEMHRELLDAVEEAADRTAIAIDERDDAPPDRPADVRLRITDEILGSPLWEEEIRPAAMAILSAARPLIERLRRLLRALHGTVEEENPETMTPLLELKSATDKIERQLGNLLRFMEESDGQCRWIEYRRVGRGRRPTIVFCTAPLEIAGTIRDRVLRRYRTVVMTSATLAVERKFDYFLSRIGALEADRLGLIGAAAMETGPSPREPGVRLLRTLLLETPFDYERQVYIGVPIDLPSPKEEGFPAALGEYLKRSLRITRGRAFVLFTAYSLLNRVHEDIAGELEEEGIACLKQGTMGRTLLTETFRRDVGSVLFATASFWEGVDVPGEALSCVVLTRLPFEVPGEPIIEARIEAMKARGGDPFGSLIVPRAVIRFRQGFGRLIRNRDDRGAVLICDRRVATAQYGQAFLRSLPTRRFHVAPGDETLERLERFFSGTEPDGGPEGPTGR